MDAVERLAAPAGEERGDVLVGADHQLLDEHVRVRLALAPGATRRGRPRTRTRSPVELHLERAAREPRRAQRRRDLRGQLELLEDLGRRLAPLGLAVGQPRVRVDHRAVEERLAVRRHLDRDAEAVL